MHTLELINLFFAGLLAGAEFVVRFGVRSTIGVLDPPSSIQLRQALIRTLRVAVPAVYLPTMLTGIAATAWNGTTGHGGGTGFTAQLAAMAALLGWTVVTFAGTVPINIGILDWQLDTPPADAPAIIRHWERLDTARTCAASAAFALFLTSVGLQLA
ncbi:anthrone oxygenase family protein [Kitasatospora sp. GAS1066B]|uniref:anthrone oxygenase family protein n=1 Tax=Kitasatospora sp. GAS1066B TaxID=3156271 RepID=UPI003516B656